MTFREELVNHAEKQFNHIVNHAEKQFNQKNGHIKGKDGSISKGFSQVGHMLKNTVGSRYPQLFKQK